MSDNGFCLDLLKNRMTDLERKVTEKDAIISFLSKQLINKNPYRDSCNGTTINDHNASFHERAEIINNNFPLGQDNKQILHAFSFNIRNYSPKVINIQRREAELNIVFRMNNFDIKGR